MRNITVIGSINMDMVIEANHMPVLGETLMGEGSFSTFGGKGANQAVAAARLGGNVTMIGAVGKDSFGESMIRNLNENGIHTETVKQVDGVGSGKAFIIVVEGNNFIVVDAGANHAILPADIDAAEEIIAASDFVVLQLEIPMETVLYAAKLAKKHGVPVLLNPAPAAPLPDELWQYIDVLTPNETECAFYTGTPIETVNDAFRAVGMLHEKGVPHVLITMGSQGAVYNVGEEAFHQPAPSVKAVDSTAAGDSFTGALAVCLSEGATFHDAALFAAKVGAMTVTRQGAQASLPYRNEIK